jgi:NAD(P)-dependent dehydrogenase (short-subunit alcohol dehydrogenase family)
MASVNPATPSDSPVALVTGGSRGIGRRIVETLVSAGFRVGFSYRRSATEADRLVREIADEGGVAACWKADARDPEATRSLVRRVLRQFGRLDTAVANAGVAGSDWSKVTPTEWDQVLRTNLVGPFSLIRSAAPALRATRGSVVVVASLAALAPFPELLSYGVSKAAVVYLVRSMALALGPEVRVNAIAPGYIRTDMNEAAWNNQRFRTSVVKRTPLGRWGTTEDAANAVAFLAGPGARFVTGATLVVDGGMSLWWDVGAGPPGPA